MAPSSEMSGGHWWPCGEALRRSPGDQLLKGPRRRDGPLFLPRAVGVCVTRPHICSAGTEGTQWEKGTV